jgi:serine/threonine protein kinase
MTPEVTDIQQIFNDAILLESEEQRSTYLDQVCGGNNELRRRVIALLKAHCEAGAFLGGSPVDTRVNYTDPVIGQQIGPYKLLEVIGEGGMGTVYMAQQTEPVHRRVALKLIKSGMDTRQVIARFEAERQALALMDHPNIARVLDAGSTENGRPFFVMELVKGRPITQFCDEQRLDTESRLKLFQKVCHAVQHAHQKGIVHRDLKPSNVLVAMYDDQPVPKVIDFGVAKATGDELTEKTMFTRFGQIVGTLEYMSPEQAQFNNLDIDTRSDIYSLGAILYDLLTGEPPFEREKIRNQPLDETLRMIREDEPTKPSTKLGSYANSLQVASNRQLTVGKLGSILSGDLDWIVMKALEKDRSRRYESATAFSNDIDQYLNLGPVMACPPSWRYRWRKFAARNAGKLVVASSLALVLLFGSAISMWQAYRASVAEQEAQAKAEESDAVLNFLLVDLLGAASPKISAGEALTVQQALHRAEAKIGSSFDDRPQVKASILHALAKTYADLDEPERALSLVRQALTIRMKELGSAGLETCSSKSLLASLTASKSPNEARAMFEEVVDIRRRKQGPEHKDTLKAMQDLGIMLRLQKDLEGSCELLSRVLDSQIRVLGPDDNGTLYTVKSLAETLTAMGKTDESIQLCQEFLDKYSGSLPPENVTLLDVRATLAQNYQREKRNAEALPIWQNLFDIRKRVLGPQHRNTIGTLLAYAQTLVNLERPNDAKALYAALIDELRSRRQVDPTNRSVRAALFMCSDFYGRLLEATDDPRYADVFQQGLSEIRSLAKDFPEETNYQLMLLEALKNAANQFAGTNMYDEGVFRTPDAERAEPLYREAIGLSESLLKHDPSNLELRRKNAVACITFSRLLVEVERYPDAIDVLESARNSLRQLVVDWPNDMDTWFDLLFCEKLLRTSLEKMGRQNDADKAAVELIDFFREQSASRIDDYPFQSRIAYGILVYGPNDQQDFASELAERCIALRPDDSFAWLVHGAIQYRRSSYQDACKSLEKADAIEPGKGDIIKIWLAMTQWQLGNRDRAAETLEEARQLLSSRGANDDRPGIKRWLNEAEKMFESGH